MSSVGSSFVNKSGRSFAPTKAVRRRPRQASPPKDAQKPTEPPREDALPAETEPAILSVPQSSAPQQDDASTQAHEPPAAVSTLTAHAELQVVQSTEQDGTVVIETNAPVAVAEEIVEALEPALKRRKIQTQSPALRISVSRQTRSVSRPASITSQSEVRVNLEPEKASPGASLNVAPVQSTASEPESVSEHIRIEIPPSHSSTSLSPTLKRTTRQRSKQPTSLTEDRQQVAKSTPTRKRRPPKAATAMVTLSAELDSIAESIEESSIPAASVPVSKSGRKTKRSTKMAEQTEEVDGDEQLVKPLPRNTRKRKATTAEKGPSAKRTASHATDEVEEPSIVTLNPDSYRAAITTKKVRKDKGVSKKSKEGRVSKPEKGGQAVMDSDVAADHDEEEIDSSAQPRKIANGTIQNHTAATSSPSQDKAVPAPVLSARQRNAERRKQKAAAREAKARGQNIGNGTADAGGLTVEGLEKDVPSVENGGPPMTSREAILARAKAKAKTSRQQRNKDKAQAEANTNGDTANGEDDDDESENNVGDRRAYTRKGTPEGSEEVTIVPSMITMSELASRNVRTGKKSEREKLMAQIDWDDVKRKRKEALEKLARNRGRRGSESESPEPAAVTNGAEEEIDEDDIDAQIERAAAKGSRRQRGVQLKEVNGEHFIDETTLIIDRHAMANEDMEELEEVEEDDLTKHFNSQTYQCLRRKDPAERVRNWDRWTTELTDKFYDYLSQFGTDFMVISHLFPGRTRREIKAKFVREERLDPDRVKVALSGSLIAAPDTWNLDEYRQAAGLEPHQMRDPAELEATLAARRKEREAEIEEAKKVQAEIARQKKLAGAESSDEDGEPKKKKEKKKRTKKAKPSGGEAEVMEEYEED